MGDALGELNNSFAAEAGALFFVTIEVELFHGGGRDVFELIFGTVLQKGVGFDSEGFVEEVGEGLAYEGSDEFVFDLLHFNKLYKRKSV